MELVLVSIFATFGMLVLEVVDLTKWERALQHEMAGMPLTHSAAAADEHAG